MPLLNGYLYQEGNVANVKQSASLISACALLKTETGWCVGLGFSRQQTKWPELIVYRLGKLIGGSSLALVGHNFRPDLLLSCEQGFLAHEKTSTPLGPPKDPRHKPAVGL